MTGDARRRRARDLPGRDRRGRRHVRDPRAGLGGLHRGPAARPPVRRDRGGPGHRVGGRLARVRPLRLRRGRRALRLRPPRRPRPGHRPPALDTLVASTEAAGIWTIQSGIFPENTASLALHQAAGFRVVGTRERIGQHHGRWRDVILIERRSPVVLPFPARTGRSSRALRPSRAALAVMATATAHLAAGSATSTPMIMKVSSAAVPTHRPRPPGRRAGTGYCARRQPAAPRLPPAPGRARCRPPPGPARSTRGR